MCTRVKRVRFANFITTRYVPVCTARLNRANFLYKKSVAQLFDIFALRRKIIDNNTCLERCRND